MESAEEVINEGFCIGCGTCTYNNDQGSMSWNARGELIPVFQENRAVQQNDICPFSDGGLDETALADLVFDANFKHDSLIGKYSNLYVGQVKSDEIRKNSSSGGVLTWVNKKLLDLNIIDGVIGVKESNEGAFFSYDICTNSSELKYFSKSRYYPVELGTVLDKIKGDGKKYSLVTLPCYAKAIRNLQLNDENLKKQIPFVFTLICGHLKTKNYSEYLGWQGGIHPEDLKRIDFRVKDREQLASKYAVRVNDDNSEVLLPFNELKLNDWGLGLFKPKACDFCDDVFGELGDLTVGDAWLPEYIADHSGNSVIIIRNKFISKLFSDFRSELDVKSLSVQDLHKSQQGGISHKRTGLGVRLNHCSESGIKTPKKRTKLIHQVKNYREQQKFLSRMSVSNKSHISFLRAKELDSLAYFYDDLKPEVKQYYKKLRPFYIRALRYIRDLLSK